MSFLVVFSDQSWVNTLRQTTEVSRAIPPGSPDRNPLLPNSMHSDLYCQSESNLSELRRCAIAMAEIRHCFFAVKMVSMVIRLGTVSLTSVSGIKIAGAS